LRRPAHGSGRLDGSAKLDVPDDITIVLFPSRSPELNPIENGW
jgi:hypothetical protein